MGLAPALGLKLSARKTAGAGVAGTTWELRNLGLFQHCLNPIATIMPSRSDHAALAAFPYRINGFHCPWRPPAAHRAAWHCSPRPQSFLLACPQQPLPAQISPAVRRGYPPRVRHTPPAILPHGLILTGRRASAALPGCCKLAWRPRGLPSLSCVSLDPE